MIKTITRILAVALLAAACSGPKAISFLGDSYTTFEGYIPEGNAIWYFNPPDTNQTDVATVEQTWWYQVVENGGYKLEVNDSYSGATICYTGYNRQDYSDRSFITRLDRVGKPKILVILGGTNDSWAGAPVGEYKYENIQREDLYSYRPALAKLLQDAKAMYPRTRLLFVMNSELREDITESSKVICEHYGVPFLQLTDIDKKSGHPSVAGMSAIATQVLSVLK
ncbi:MAG: hypothetical protein J6T58_00840 [Bacteroidales bacterium]|nr:hypothetical protein [Bacteroidales bacterium]